MSRREKRKQQTRQAILEAAIELFSQKGYEKTSIDEIARSAGIGKGTVYSYFTTKKAIIRGFCEYELEQIHAELVRRSNQDTPILEQMVVIYMTEFRQVTRNREFGRLFMREAVFPDDAEVAGNLEVDNKYFQLLFPIIETAKKRGELRAELEPLHICAHFYSLFILIIHAWYTGRVAGEEVEEGMRTLFQQALTGLLPRESSLQTDHFPKQS
jgi:AcrR family transcriptional regulator